MGFISWLKSIGKSTAKVVPYASWATSMLPSGIGQTVRGFFEKIVLAIGVAERTAETLGVAKSGAAKLQAVAPIVADLIASSELVVGKEIADEAMFSDGVNDITTGIVKIMNALHPPTPPPTLQPTPPSAQP